MEGARANGPERPWLILTLGKEVETEGIDRKKYFAGWIVIALFGAIAVGCVIRGEPYVITGCLLFAGMGWGIARDAKESGFASPRVLSRSHWLFLAGLVALGALLGFVLNRI